MAIYVFILAPILITFAVSFNASNRSSFRRGLSLRWWGGAFRPEWTTAAVQPGARAPGGRLVATCSRCRSPSRCIATNFPARGIRALTLGPLMLPALVTGVGLLQFFQYVGLRD